MRMLRKNKQKFYYSNYDPTKSPTPVLDSTGNETGEYEQPYTARAAGWANILTPLDPINHFSGYGSVAPYQRSMIMSTEYGINEYSRLWIDDLESDEHDFIVQRVAKTLNGIRITAKKVSKE